MRIAYLDCSTGISGDMTLAALIDAGVDESAIRAGIESLALPGVRLCTEEVLKGGFRATSVRVEHPEQHAHRHLGDITKIINAAGRISAKQKDLALKIFAAVAAAEAKVHGSSIDEVHFHEVGAIDSIVDIVGAAIGFDLLGAEQIVCGPVPTGRGQVRIAHGVCTVPTPGTAELLRGIPLVDVPIDAELTTPTGAAILKVLVDRFAALPPMKIDSIGYGAGTMSFPDRANLLRIFVGSVVASPERDVVTLLEANLDDVSGEVVGYAKRKLLEAGALDVFTTPIQMKKDRPGVILSVIATPKDVERLEAILFAETGTFGIRKSTLERTKRARIAHAVETTWGPITGKIGAQPGGATIFTPEFESCAEIAAAKGVPLREVYRAAESAYLQSSPQAIPMTVAAVKSDHHHDHDHSRHHDHSHDHAHDHSHSHDHSHDHDHGRGHHHDHG